MVKSNGKNEEHEYDSYVYDYWHFGTVLKTLAEEIKTIHIKLLKQAQLWRRILEYCGKLISLISYERQLHTPGVKTQWVK